MYLRWMDGNRTFIEGGGLVEGLLEGLVEVVVEALVALEVVHHPREQHQVVEPLRHWVLQARREDARARVVGVVAPPACKRVQTAEFRREGSLLSLLYLSLLSLSLLSLALYQRHSGGRVHYEGFKRQGSGGKKRRCACTRSRRGCSTWGGSGGRVQ